MKATSVIAYRRISANGLLGTRRMQVYSALANSFEPLTQNEVWKKIRESGVSLMLNSVTPRFAELETLGVIKVVGERMCTVTGHTDTTYIDTGDLPDETRVRKKREVWHVVTKLKDKPDETGIRVEYSADAAEAYGRTMGVRFVEIIHFKEVR